MIMFYPSGTADRSSSVQAADRPIRAQWSTQLRYGPGGAGGTAQYVTWLL